MENRSFPAAHLLVLLCIVSFATPPALAQTNSRTPGKPRALPRTPDGHPDMHGVWDFRTITPLERPTQFAGKDVLTAEEVTALEQQTAESRVDRAPRAGDPGTYNQFWFDFGTRADEKRRTSLI